MSSSMADQGMISGFGKFHTNDADTSDPGKRLTPYVPIDLAGIRNLVDNPQPGLPRTHLNGRSSPRCIAVKRLSKRPMVSFGACGQTLIRVKA